MYYSTMQPLIWPNMQKQNRKNLELENVIKSVMELFLSPHSPSSRAWAGTRVVRQS